MTFTVYINPDVSVPFIRAAAALIEKTFGPATPYALPNKSTSCIESGNGPKLPDTSSHLERLLRLVREAKEYLEKLLSDYSVAGKAKLKAFYDYVIWLFEELRKICPDWMLTPLALAIGLIIAFIISVLICYAPGIIRNERAQKLERELREAQWLHTQRMNQSMNQSIRWEQWKKLRKMQSYISRTDARRILGYDTPEGLVPGHPERRSIDMAIEVLKYELMR